jgi:hypothetical protein
LPFCSLIIYSSSLIFSLSFAGSDNPQGSSSISGSFDISNSSICFYFSATTSTRSFLSYSNYFTCTVSWETTFLVSEMFSSKRDFKRVIQENKSYLHRCNLVIMLELCLLQFGRQFFKLLFILEVLRS